METIRPIKKFDSINSINSINSVGSSSSSSGRISDSDLAGASVRNGGKERVDLDLDLDSTSTTNLSKTLVKEVISPILDLLISPSPPAFPLPSSTTPSTASTSSISLPSAYTDKNTSSRETSNEQEGVKQSLSSKEVEALSMIKRGFENLVSSVGTGEEGEGRKNGLAWKVMESILIGVNEFVSSSFSFFFLLFLRGFRVILITVYSIEQE